MLKVPRDGCAILRYGMVLAIIATLAIYSLRPTRPPNYQQYTYPTPYDNFHDPGSLTSGTTKKVAQDALGNPAADSQPQFHVVIAHFQEEPLYIGRWLSTLRAIPSINSLGVSVSVYTKHPKTDLAEVGRLSGANEVISVPNVGREGSTYLNYILTHWDNLPRYTLFAQAVVKKAQNTGTGPEAGTLQSWLRTRLETQFSAERKVGFMSLDRKHDICHCGVCSDMSRSGDFYPMWPQLYAMMEGKVCSSQQSDIMSFNGHFIVSRERIRARPRELYEYLKHLIDAPEDHWIHEEPEPKWFERKKGESNPSEPKFGHTLERLWHVIFGCGDPKKVVDCEVDLTKAEGPGGCTCLDT